MFKKIVGLAFSNKGKNAKDVEMYIKGLVEGGATEFFTGYNPPYWYEKFGFEVSPNGRFAEHEQITDFELLKQIVIEVHKYNLEIFINLNAWYYTSETFPLIRQMVEEFIKAGVDGIICGNISILEYLKTINYSGKINISTIMAVYNNEAIRFLLENYKINKVILSREVTLKEIEEIVTSFPKTKFEVFGEGDFCRYNNGLCFAEHKYETRDICTVVLDNMEIKHRFRPDFKKLVLDETISNEEKANLLNMEYKSDTQILEEIFEKLDLGIEDKESLKKEMLNLVLKSSKKSDLFFDGLKSPFSKENKNILLIFKRVKYLIRENFKDEILENLKIELESNINSGMTYYAEKLKNIGGEAKIKALELQNLYNKGDNLNLYSYLFFSKFPNIETVKFPTRGRNYNEKLKIIEEVVNNKKIDGTLLDRGISPKRTHYDLSYLFGGDKLWFRKLLKK
ncbi:MAG: U32 family peptidase [Candidatus Gracilibacteria bacterium]|nr:U32 family peptidase [Candidatus Gracilibacteria bacterium]